MSMEDMKKYVYDRLTGKTDLLDLPDYGTNLPNLLKAPTEQAIEIMETAIRRVVEQEIANGYLSIDQAKKEIHLYSGSDGDLLKTAVVTCPEGVRYEVFYNFVSVGHITYTGVSADGCEINFGSNYEPHDAVEHLIINVNMEL